MDGRTIVVGDIHGCYDELEDMLAKVGFARGRPANFGWRLNNEGTKKQGSVGSLHE